MPFQPRVLAVNLHCHAAAARSPLEVVKGDKVFDALLLLDTGYGNEAFKQKIENVTILEVLDNAHHVVHIRDFRCHRDVLEIRSKVIALAEVV